KCKHTPTEGLIDKSAAVVLISESNDGVRVRMQYEACRDPCVKKSLDGGSGCACVKGRLAQFVNHLLVVERIQFQQRHNAFAPKRCEAAGLDRSEVPTTTFY